MPELPFPVRRIGMAQYDTIDELDADGNVVQRCLVIDVVVTVPLPVAHPITKQPMASQAITERIVVPFGNGSWLKLAKQLETGEAVPDVQRAPAGALDKLGIIRR